jgi:plasmid stabilization system protein ParE
MKHIILSPDGAADLNAAVRWYDNIDSKLALRFSLEVIRIMSRVEQSPLQFPRVTPRVRRAMLKRFPYVVYFSLNIRILSVIAVVHQRRNPDVWMKRSNGENN